MSSYPKLAHPGEVLLVSLSQVDQTGREESSSCLIFLIELIR